MKNPGMPKMEKAKLLGGQSVFPGRIRCGGAELSCQAVHEGDVPAGEYDFKGKGGGSGEAGQDELLLELVNKILI